MSIRKQLLLIFAASSILPLVLFGGGVYLFFKNNLQNQILENFIMLSGATHEHLHTFSELIQGRAIDFSSDGYIRDAAEEIISGRGGERTISELNGHLKNNKMALDPYIIAVSVVNLAGKVASSTQEKEIGKNYFSEDFFLGGLKLPYKNAFISDYKKIKIDGESIALVVSAPLVSKDGTTLLGVIALYYSNQKLNEILLNSLPPEIFLETFETYFVDRNDFLVASSNTDFYGEFLEKKIKTLPVQNCRDGVETAGIYENYAGKQVIGSAFCLHHSNWIEITEVGTAEIFGAVYKIRDFLVFFSLIMIIAAIFVILIFSQQKVKQIGQLMRLSEELAKGNFDFQIPITTKSEIGRLAGSFNEMAGRLKALDKVKYNFLKAVSHQMRTPLVETRWSLELLAGGKLGVLTDRQQQFVKLLYESNGNIIQIVNDVVLALSIEEGTFRVQKEAWAIEKIIEGVIELVRAKAETKQLSVVFERPPVFPRISVDRKKIENAIFRLLDNAVIYGGVKNDVIVKLEIRGDHLIFSVQDFGVGIPEEEQKNIFEKFYRGSRAYSIVPDASGLGLFIAKTAIEAHGGKIWFESKEGKGTTFYFSLPILSA